ncbi:MAG: substrate-binding domain-containing protein [Alphaproteobacteria bacterium]|nr:substrate-binding domain-containing protein [Alphaproteobacteria bacterium]
MRRRRPRSSSFSTMADVARRAGVSTASVSRVLNTPDQVSRELRRRVESAVADLRYVRHGAARALAARRSHTIGAIVPTLGTAIFATGVEALQRRLDALGHALLVAHSQNDPAVELRQLRTLLERGVDGIVLVGHRHRPALYRLLAETRTPYVCTYTFGNGRHACVGIDHARAMATLVAHLLALGHRRFGVITSPTRDNDRIAQRLQGAVAAVRSAGCAPPEVVEAPYAIRDGREALRALLARAPEATAVICTTDIHAVGVVAEARTLGLDVPGRLSVTGFDDLALAADLEPPLTTIRVPAEEIGARAAEMLVGRVLGKPVATAIKLDAELNVRASTGAAPRR